MPAPTLNSQSSATASGTTTISVTLPAAAAGDVLVMLCYAENANSTTPQVTSVSGASLTWQRRSRAHGSLSGSIDIWWSVATAALTSAAITATYPFSFDDAACSVLSVSGCYTASPWDANTSLPAAQDNATTPSLSGITTSGAAFVIFATGSAAGWSGPGTVPSGFTLANYVSNGGGINYAKFAVAYNSAASAISSSTISWGSALPGSNGNEALIDVLTSSAPVGTPATPPPQLNTQAEANGSTTTSPSVTLPAAAAGDVIVLVAYAENSASTNPQITGVSGGGLTWTLRARSHGSTHGDMEIWWAVATAAMTSVTVTATYASSLDDGNFYVFSVSGCNTTSPWEPNTSLPAVQSSTASSSFSGITTSGKNFLIYANGCCAAWPSTTSGSAPLNFNTINVGNNTGGSNFAYSAVAGDATATALSGATVAWGTATSTNTTATESILDALVGGATSGGGGGGTTAPPIQPIDPRTKYAKTRAFFGRQIQMTVQNQRQVKFTQFLLFTTAIRSSAAVRETLYSASSSIRVASAVREALYSQSAYLRTASVVREVLYSVSANQNATLDNALMVTTIS